MYWEQRSMVGYNGWRLFIGDSVNNTRHHLLPTVGMINRSTQTARNMLSWEMKHKSLKIIFAGCGMCVLSKLFGVQTPVPHHSSAVLGWWIIFNSRPCCEPGAMTKRAAWLPLVLGCSLIYGSNCLLLFLTGRWNFWTSGPNHWCCAGKLSSAGEGQKKREKEEKSNNLCHNHYPGGFSLSEGSLLNRRLSCLWTLSIKRYQADEQMVTNQMGNERCLSGKVWQLTEIAS